MRTQHFIIPLMIVASLALQGCATSRSELKLSSATAAPAQAPIASKGTVIIRNVKDERIFEQAPGDPSIPSLGFEGAAKATAETKSRAIGRKRNGFGKALGDILLENGQTVEGVVRENLTAALSQSGYQVLNSSTNDPKAILLDAHIKQFWAWFQPGFWAITLHTKIETNLKVSSTSMPIPISIHAESSGLAATDSAWIEIVDKALLAYRDKVKATNIESK